MKKIVLIGTPGFTIPFFDKILNSKEFEVIAIITREAKGKKLEKSAVAIWGLKQKSTNHKSIKILEVKSINKDKESEEVFRKADCALVFAFGEIIAERILKLPKNGFFNIHPSKIPDLRGPSPLQTAIIRGDITSSITLMKMNMKMDEGPIIAQKSFKLNKKHKISVILRELGKWGPSWILKELQRFFETQNSKEQNQEGITYCYLIKKENYFIKEEKPEEILNKIRGFGYVYLDYEGKKIKCFLAKLYEEGDLINIMGVAPIFVQLPGKKMMHIRNFLNGHQKQKKN